MKKRYLLSVAVLALAISTGSAFAQEGEGMSYQAAFRNSTSPVANANVNMQFTVIKDSVNGTVVYKETQTATSTSLGVVNCIIGKGTPTTGTWKTIAWNHSPMYLNVQADTTGATSFVDLGTTQLVASPYAKSANGITMFETGTQNPYKMVVSHSSAYPTWGMRYNDTTDGFTFVGGGNPSVDISSWNGNITTYNTYTPGPYPYANSQYGNIVAAGNITTANKVQRGADTSNMLPIAWGTVSSTGTIVNSSNNVTIAGHPSAGIFDITIAGESYTYVNYTTIVSSGGAGFISWGSLSNNLRVFTYNTTGTLTDQFFTFVTYKK
jgi:hypothetical protein